MQKPLSYYLDALEISQNELSLLIGVPAIKIGMWYQGEKPLPTLVRKYLELLIKIPNRYRASELYKLRKKT